MCFAYKYSCTGNFFEIYLFKSNHSFHLKETFSRRQTLEMKLTKRKQAQLNVRLFLTLELGYSLGFHITMDKACNMGEFES